MRNATVFFLFNLHWIDKPSAIELGKVVSVFALYFVNFLCVLCPRILAIPRDFCGLYILNSLFVLMVLIVQTRYAFLFSRLFKLIFSSNLLI